MKDREDKTKAVKNSKETKASKTKKRNSNELHFVSLFRY